MPDVPHIKILEPEESKEEDGEESSKKTTKFAVPSTPSRSMGRRHGRHVSFSNTKPAVDRSRPTGDPHRMGFMGTRRKVALAPGHSAMDWERSKSSTNMRGIDPASFPMRVTKAQLSQHKSGRDCWMALNGKVYNITGYLSFHPGGKDILVENAGKDATLMFQRYHSWVNYERILDSCFIGFLA